MLTKERAQEIWSQRGPENNVDHAMTEDEQAIVMREWKKMPGYTCWMDAFYRFLNGYAEHQRPTP